MVEKPGRYNFADKLTELVAQSGYHIADLARLTGIPRTTLNNWLKGYTRKPQHWQDVVRIAQALRLKEVETNSFLQVAGYPLLSNYASNVRTTKSENCCSSLLRQMP